jgi:hypothetical protein
MVNEKEVLFANRQITIANTKDKQRHKARIMVLSNRHVEAVPEQFYTYALGALVEVGKSVFRYTSKFVVFDSTYESNQDHWHLVASDLDSTADDFEQMLATPWIQVVDIARARHVTIELSPHQVHSTL